MKKNILNIILISIFGILLSGCYKEIVGPQGPPGEDGADGNANVKTSNYSNLIWVNETSNGYTKKATLSVTDLTQDIINSGTITVSGSNDNVKWQTLPLTYPPNISWWYTFEINKVYIYCYQTTGEPSSSLLYNYAKVTIVQGN